MPTAMISDSSCSAKAEHPVTADLGGLLDRPPARTMTITDACLLPLVSVGSLVIHPCFVIPICSPSPGSRALADVPREDRSAPDLVASPVIHSPIPSAAR